MLQLKLVMIVETHFLFLNIAVKFDDVNKMSIVIHLLGSVLLLSLLLNSFFLFDFVCSNLTP